MDCANCTWAEGNHTNPIAAALTCGDFTSRAAVAARNAASNLTVIPERCPTCNEALTPKATKGAIKCRCDMPYMPNCVSGHGKGCNCFRVASDAKPLTGSVRYGGR
jgi:hypothetical protein